MTSAGARKLRQDEDRVCRALVELDMIAPD